MKIVFAGSPEFAVPALEKLIEAGKEVVAVVTQPDKPVGRKQVLTPTPVKKYAVSKGLPVFDFKKSEIIARPSPHSRRYYDNLRLRTAFNK